ncbi:unnamed protein product [Ilex paraguariensis]|uniref:Bifunctional inhibitor/plant lipid transfer protein/seed storage helical domain-containing protein n=1 Tax=Ilex paraguariensis TaxID=185542 RepID=A0ABC8UKW1_9AQUA
MKLSSYLVGNSAQLTAQCCGGAQALDKLASASQADRQAICKCLKNAAQRLPILQDRAQQIPPLCQLTTNLKIDPNIDCTKSASIMLSRL